MGTNGKRDRDRDRDRVIEEEKGRKRGEYLARTLLEFRQHPLLPH